ncbi:MAG TPA: PAS domain S-box protein, partial [Gemmatimonadales bacterium]|nr:PAS domain S-box protein [Gemmatimonadales bacterium]
FHENPLPMWVYDQHTLAFLDVNEAAVRHYGYSRDEFLAMTLKDIRPPDEVPRFLASLPGSPAGLYEAGVWRHRKKDGSEIEVEITRRRVDVGGRTVGLVLAHDITSRLAAERSLRASEEALRRLNAELERRVADRTATLQASEARFRALAETANDAIISADAEGRITYFNPAAERIFGYSASEAVGEPLTLLMPERFRAAHQAGLARYRAGGEARVVGRTVELAGRRKDGAEFPIELSLAAWSGGEGPSFTAILRDISDRKQAQAAIEEHARQLDRANAELQAVNRELEAFSYSVSHDLRAPLRAMDGFSRIVLEEHAGGLDPEGRRLLDVVRENARRMGQLIDDLLAFSRLGRQPLRARSVDLVELAREVAAELRAAEPERAIEITVAPLPPARGDRALLRQVLVNLLQNAVKFTRGRAPARIEVGARDGGNGVVYYVADNGVGFDPRYADKLFGVFQRLHRAEEFEGTGVGLATVQRIVHRHGGRVWAEGAPDHGATFYFTLAAEEAAQ